MKTSFILHVKSMGSSFQISLIVVTIKIQMRGDRYDDEETTLDSELW